MYAYKLCPPCILNYFVFTLYNLCIHLQCDKLIHTRPARIPKYS